MKPLDGYRLMIRGPITLAENVQREIGRPVVPHCGQSGQRTTREPLIFSGRFSRPAEGCSRSLEAEDSLRVCHTGAGEQPCRRSVAPLYVR